MHNDVKQCFAARTYIVVVVATNESNMASYFPEARNLNGSNADRCSDGARPSNIRARAICLSFKIGQMKLQWPWNPDITILDITIFPA